MSLSDKKLKLTAALYAKAGALKHVRKTGRLPPTMKSGGLHIPMRLLIEERGTDITLTPDEQLVYDAIVREGRLPAGSIHLVNEAEKTPTRRSPKRGPQSDHSAPISSSPAAMRRAGSVLSSTDLCEVHGWHFEKTKVWVAYGLFLCEPSEPFPGYFKAKIDSFPNSSTFVLGGCVLSGNDPLLGDVSVCPECQVREVDWRAETAERLRRERGGPEPREGTSSSYNPTRQDEKEREAQAELERELQRLRDRVAELKGTSQERRPRTNGEVIS